MKNLSLRHALGLATLLALSACAVREAAPSAFADFDEGTDFSGYQAYAWMRADPVIVTAARPLNPNTSTVLMRETEKALKARGFRRVGKQEDADFVVSFVLGSRESLQVNEYPGRFRQVGEVGVVYGERSDVREVSTGAISIEFFSQASGQRTWTGWATTGLTMDVYANSEETIREMVALILDQFPPKA